MASGIEMSVAQRALLAAIQRIHLRWRLRVALQGAAVVLGAAAIGVVIGSLLMVVFHFAPAVVIAVRLVFYGGLIAVVVWYLASPLLRKVNDEQVALYLEEREPSLGALVVSAVAVARSDVSPSVRSPSFVARIVETAVARVEAMGEGAGYERRQLAVSSAIVLGILVGGGLLHATGAGRYASMLNPFMDPFANPYSILVQPGNAEVPRGGDQVIRAALRGFTARQATLVIWRSGSKRWERVPMTVTRDSSAFQARLFDIQSQVNYYVEATGFRSPTFSLDVMELPYVKTLGLALRAPAYTGLPVKIVEQGRDVTVQEGTVVSVRVTTTKPVKGARIAVDGDRTVPMARSAGDTWTGTFTATKSGFYQIELEALTGGFTPGSLQYDVDVITDRPPSVVFLKPKGDVNVRAMEEVQTEIRTVDDFGVTSVELRYSINGELKEHVLPLFSGPSRREMTASHLFSLEELRLKEGDLIAYYARATDNDAIHGGKVATSDLQFFSVISYQSNEKQPKGGKGGAGPGQKPNLLRVYSERQRQITSATFGVDRNRTTVTASAFRGAVGAVVLWQSELQSQVELFLNAVSQSSRIKPATRDSLVKLLRGAITEMKRAEASLQQQETRHAWGNQQRAVFYLQQADKLIEHENQREHGTTPAKKAVISAGLIQVANLSGLQDYDTIQALGGARDDELRQMDQMVETLKQLTAAVQQQAELSRDPQSLRRFVPAAEQIADQLHQLAGRHPDDERVRQSMAEARQATDALQRATGGQGTDAVELGAVVLHRWRKARELLETSRWADDDSRTTNRVVVLVRTIANAERAIQDALTRLPAADASSRSDRERDVMQRKDDLIRDVGVLESTLEKTVGKLQKDFPGVAKKFAAVLETIRVNNLQHTIEMSKQIPGNANLSDFEQQIILVTDRLPSQVADAVSAMERMAPAAISGAARAQQLVGRAVSLAASPPSANVAADYRALRDQMEALRDDLRRRDVDTTATAALGRAITRSQSLDRLVETPQDSLRLRHSGAAVAEALQAAEFALRKQLDLEEYGRRQVFSENFDIPTKFKPLVAEYYRTLAEWHNR